MTRKTTLVEVTADDIARGQADEQQCPVAHALRRYFNGPNRPELRVSRARDNGRWVGVVRISYGDDLDYRIRLSQAVGRFTADFDAGKPVKPFAFRVWR